MSEFGEQSLLEFLDAVAEATPAPGGGTSAGVTCALAAGLVEMCARLAKRSEEAAEAAELRGRALALAEEELSSYAPVLAASSPEERERALEAAAEPPARIAETAAEAAELGARVAAGASAAVRGDALTGVVLAEAAAATSARLAEINTDGEGAVYERARAATERAAEARASATGAASGAGTPPA